MLLRVLEDGLQIHRMTTPEDAAAYRDAFVAAYIRIFAGPPYLEDFSEEEAGRIWTRLTTSPHHITLVVLDAGRMVAFGSAIPLSADPSVARALMGLVPNKHTMYLAELGVLPPYRDRQLARVLVNLRIKLMDHERYSHVVLRAVEGKNEALAMYRSLDFTDMGVSMMVTHRRMNGEVRSDERHFMSRVLSQVAVSEE